MRRLILIFLGNLISLIALGQSFNDSISFVYFHNTSDTVIMIEKYIHILPDSLPKLKYSFTKLYMDKKNLKPGSSQTIHKNHKVRLSEIKDSLYKRNYSLGINECKKCKNYSRLYNLDCKDTCDMGNLCLFAIENVRIYKTDTISNEKFRSKIYCFDKKQSPEKTIKEHFQINNLRMDLD